MASLLSATDIGAVYESKTHQLVLTAQANGLIINAKFARLEFFGGLKFALEGFFGGPGPVGPEDITPVTTPFPITLPLPHFNNKTVLVETADGPKTIEIKYTGLKGTAPADLSKDLKIQNTNIGSVLTPINLHLPAEGETSFTAVIPKPEGDYQISVVPSFNEDLLRLVNATVRNGVVTYTFRWAKTPTGDQNPQLINLTTSYYNGITGPAAHTTSIIQGYLVHLVVFQK
ncbi:uncharacterized protein CCOS01_11215 [Colletotrichum costaricense]|uniref:Uncharacterized protein n=1 Tax=Colletotrichum costaricense TaxID=1209916 RepID=A0AAJ0DXK6_9PEZI|nr:uncharacterized protein CCOS01_11215 [Colletotrichum costaricense]KAK1519564.1 hypothetical protein CCOS01_11215 [Colletotrichum costaricense]